jgi:transposase
VVIRIVLDGLRGEDSIAELCRREGIATSLYSSWSKEFLSDARAATGSTPRRTGRSGWPATPPVRPRRRR